MGFVTFLSVYYMTGVKRSLEIFRCISKNPELFDATSCPDWKVGDSPLRLIYSKKILFASDGAGEVVCKLFNYTTCDFEVKPGEGPPTQGLFKELLRPFGKTTVNSPSYLWLQRMATFFTLLYGICIPLFIFIALSQGKNQLNHLSFGRRYGYLILFLSLDMTLQMVRLYFRYVEGEGKFGKRQELVLQDLDKDTRRLQELSGSLLAPNQRQLFQKWLNNVASEDEKLLTKAAFTSLSHYLKMHSDHSMPVMIQHLAAFPVVGGFFTWAYKEQHELRLKARAKRNRKLSNKKDLHQAIKSSKSSESDPSLGTSSRAGSYIQRKRDSVAKKVRGLGQA